MIDLKKEIEKYKPILEVDGIEESTKKSEIEDIIDLIDIIKRD